MTLRMKPTSAAVIALLSAMPTARANQGAKAEGFGTALPCTRALLMYALAYEEQCFSGKADEKSRAMKEAVRILNERVLALGYAKSADLSGEKAGLVEVLSKQKRSRTDFCARVNPADPHNRSHPGFFYADFRRHSPEAMKRMAQGLAKVPAEKLTAACL